MGLTPLLAACQSGQLEAVKMLLASGADVNHCHVKTGRTALMEAGARTNASVVKELLRYGAIGWAHSVYTQTHLRSQSDHHTPAFPP